MNVPIPTRSSGDYTSAMSPPRSPSRVSGISDTSIEISLEADSFKLPKPSLITSPSVKQQPPTPKSAAPIFSSKTKDIPQFYIPRDAANNITPEVTDCINKIFGPSSGAGAMIHDPSVLIDTLVNSLGLSRYFAEPLFKKIQAKSGGSGIRRSDFTNYWISHFEVGNVVRNFFSAVKQENCAYITRNDFREFLWSLLDHHPGLAFLRDSPEFQERYADTVICRIFYHYDYRGIGKLYETDFRRVEMRKKFRPEPSIITAWLDLDSTEDINTIRQYFSYEHFYVLYCKFWDLDSDHDFLLDKEDLLKYDGHAYSAKAIERIFSEVGGIKFTSGIPGKMNYDDFVWFILSDEDKSTERSLEFLFRLVDIDGDGVIRDHEMSYFYDDQVHRLECINQEAPNFLDIMCQLNDLIRPAKFGQFCISDFLKRRKNNAGVFFSILLSLNKFMAYEQRDPFAIKQDQLNNPDLSDWDRFCAGEYVRLAMEAGGAAASADQDTAANLGRNIDGGIIR
jgi:serine/threonine-protein phosphatase 2A regulatory subunit B''